MTAQRQTIETTRLRLRQVERGDLEAIASYCTLPDVQRYLTMPVRDPREAKDLVEAMSRQITLRRPGDTLTYAIVREIDHSLIGHISLRFADATAAQGELMFALAPAFRGQGYCQEAVARLLDLAFRDFRLHRVFGRCDARNSRASRLMQRLGLRLEAHYREHALFRGDWDEELHFAILDREWGRSDKVRELHHRIA